MLHWGYDVLIYFFNVTKSPPFHQVELTRDRKRGLHYATAAILFICAAGCVALVSVMIATSRYPSSGYVDLDLDITEKNLRKNIVAFQNISMMNGGARRSFAALNETVS